MKSNHRFNLSLDWPFVSELISMTEKKSQKNHTIKIFGKADLIVSAAGSFKGDISQYNPEDLLLASLTSCHMMSYLYCCKQNSIEVLSYKDSSEAILEVYPDGSGRIVKAILQPVIEIVDYTQSELALSLHDAANKLCFIANSCNFPIENHAIIIEKK